MKDIRNMLSARIGAYLLTRYWCKWYRPLVNELERKCKDSEACRSNLLFNRKMKVSLYTLCVQFRYMGSEYDKLTNYEKSVLIEHASFESSFRKLGMDPVERDTLMHNDTMTDLFGQRVGMVAMGFFNYHHISMFFSHIDLESSRVPLRYLFYRVSCRASFMFTLMGCYNETSLFNKDRGRI